MEYKVFNEILEHGDIRTVFQPIISLRDGSVMGYEALSRGPSGTEFESPQKLFSIAEKNNRVWDLEQICRIKALAAIDHLKIGTMLFLNVNPDVINDNKFKQGFTKEVMDKYSINPNNIVFEITERKAIINMGEFMNAISYYKGQDYQIAIDDAGAGYSGLNLISNVQPHYLKLDMHLIRGIDKNPTKHALVKSMYEFSRTTATYLIAEGIETPEELQTLINIGVPYGQGYFIQRPNPEIPPIHSDVINTLKIYNAQKNHLYGYSLSELYISNLCVQAITVNEQVSIGHVYDMLQKNPDIYGFCVTRDDIVLGVVTRTMLYNKVGGIYGYSIYNKKPITTIMNMDFLQVEYTTPVNIAGKLAMARPVEFVYDFITVTHNEQYFGIVTIQDLLNRTLEIEVNNARDMNPLTALPGNKSIETALKRIINDKQNYCVLYLDIDNFKSYNDNYGFENGDKVIENLAKILKDIIGEIGFVGHIGGDDFVAIIDSDKASEVCEIIIAKFDKLVKSFYSDEDIKNDYVIAKSRRGHVEQFPLMSISIAGLYTGSEDFTDIFMLSEKAMKIKKECKLTSGSIYKIH
ncbi:MAG: GGDEF domain-containing protein [Eubacteriales bacterium]